MKPCKIIVIIVLNVDNCFFLFWAEFTCTQIYPYFFWAELTRTQIHLTFFLGGIQHKLFFSPDHFGWNVHVPVYLCTANTMFTTPFILFIFLPGVVVILFCFLSKKRL